MKWTKKKVTNLFFFIGVAAVVAMLLTFKVSFVELWHYICDAGLWLIPIIGIWFIIYSMNAFAWMQITKSNRQEKLPLGFWHILKLTISGYALNYATPVAGLGGEPYRIMELSRHIGNQRATSSVILYVMTHILAHITFWFVAIILFIVLILTGVIQCSNVFVITASLTALICLLGIYLFYRGYKRGLVVKFMHWICKIPGLKRWGNRFLERHEQSLINIDEQIAMLHRQDKRTFYSSLLTEFASRLVQSLEIFFMLLLFKFDNGGTFSGLALTYLYSVFILAVATICSNLLGFLPLQLGGQEGGYVLAITLLGIPAAVGMFICIITRLREIVWILIGLVLMKINPNPTLQQLSDKP